jgi:hypothetical protein
VHTSGSKPNGSGPIGRFARFARTTPLLFGLYSLVTLFGAALAPPWLPLAIRP